MFFFFASAQRHKRWKEGGRTIIRWSWGLLDIFPWSPHPGWTSHKRHCRKATTIILDVVQYWTLNESWFWRSNHQQRFLQSIGLENKKHNDNSANYQQDRTKEIQYFVPIKRKQCRIPCRTQDINAPRIADVQHRGARQFKTGRVDSHRPWRFHTTKLVRWAPTKREATKVTNKAHPWTSWPSFKGAYEKKYSSLGGSERLLGSKIRLRGSCLGLSVVLLLSCPRLSFFVLPFLFSPSFPFLRVPHVLFVENMNYQSLTVLEVLSF